MCKEVGNYRSLHIDHGAAAAPRSNDLDPAGSDVCPRQKCSCCSVATQCRSPHKPSNAPQHFLPKLWRKHCQDWFLANSVSIILYDIILHIILHCLQCRLQRAQVDRTECSGPTQVELGEDNSPLWIWKAVLQKTFFKIANLSKLTMRNCENVFWTLNSLSSGPALCPPT